MLARSFDYGRYLTFQRPLGDFGRLVSQGTEAWPILKLIIPFVRTPMNLLKFAIERSPAAPLLKEWRRDIAAGGAKRDLAIAKVMVGTGIGATIFSMAGEGNPLVPEGGVGPDFLSPIWTDTARNDPTLGGLLSAGVSISPPQRYFTQAGERTEWTPSQYDRLQVETGRGAKPALDSLVRSAEWSWMDSDDRQDAVGR